MGQITTATGDKSSLVHTVYYDPSSKDMTVRLHGNRQYVYGDVEPHEHNAFISADSLGKHFSTVIAKRPHRTL